MLKHYINYEDNTYYIEQDGVIVMSIELSKEKLAGRDQIIIKTPKEVYAGPIDFLDLSGIDNK